MFKNTSQIFIPSILIGIIITICFLASMSWRQLQNCQDNYGGTQPAEITTFVTERIPRVNCAGLAYGYPFKYLQSEARVGFSLAPPNASNDSKLFMGITGQTRWNAGNFIADVALWSGISFAAIILLRRFMTNHTQS